MTQPGATYPDQYLAWARLRHRQVNQLRGLLPLDQPISIHASILVQGIRYRNRVKPPIRVAKASDQSLGRIADLNRLAEQDPRRLGEQLRREFTHVSHVGLDEVCVEIGL